MQLKQQPMVTDVLLQLSRSAESWWKYDQVSAVTGEKWSKASLEHLPHWHYIRQQPVDTMRGGGGGGEMGQKFFFFFLKG